MAPKKNAGKQPKRAQDEDSKEALPESKRGKTVGSGARSDVLLEPVLTALGQDTEGEMLRQMARTGILAPTSEPRHRYQAAVVEMLREALTEAEAEMISVCDADRTAADAKLEAILRNNSEALEASKGRWGQDNVALHRAWQAHAAAAKQLAPVAKAAEQAAQSLAAAQAALSEHFPGLEAGGEASKMSQHIKAITPLLAPAVADESLARAFPVAAGKQPGERGAFDRTAIVMVREELVKYTATIAGKKVEAEAAAAQLKVSESAADKDLQRARVKMQESAMALREAELDWMEANDDIAMMEAMKEERQQSLEEFRRGPIAAFDKLYASELVVPAADFSSSWWDATRQNAAGILASTKAAVAVAA